MGSNEAVAFDGQCARACSFGNANPDRSVEAHAIVPPRKYQISVGRTGDVGVDRDSATINADGPCNAYRVAEGDVVSVSRLTNRQTAKRGAKLPVAVKLNLCSW